MITEKKTRAPRKPKTPLDIDQEINNLQAQIDRLKLKKHAETLDELVISQGSVEAFMNIRRLVVDVPDVVILAAIGKAVGIPRLNISQSEPAKRAPWGSKKKAHDQE